MLSLFPGIGLLDHAFELEGFCVVRGPDVLWGGDAKTFHPPEGKFDGVIGGPPCQAHCSYANLNKAQGKSTGEDLVPEFIRIVDEAQPFWWLMENAASVPVVETTAWDVQVLNLNARQFGSEQDRERRFQFGRLPNVGPKIWPEIEPLEPMRSEAVCLASEGRAGLLSNKKVGGKQSTQYKPRRDPARFCELQGLPADFMDRLPFTVEWKYRVVGNGVPLPMGRAFARAIREAYQP